MVFNFLNYAPSSKHNSKRRQTIYIIQQDILYNDELEIVYSSNRLRITVDPAQPNEIFGKRGGSPN